jgi:polar amino acid transport system substrate-binding protein
MGVNPSRAAQIAFSPPLILLPYTYLVPPGSSIRSVEDVDRPGIRIAVVRNHESTAALSGMLKHAKMIDAEIPDAAFELLRKGQADAFASPHAALLDYVDKLPGSRVLDDYYGANLLAIAVPKGYAARLNYMSDFTEEVKASGLLQRSIDSASQRGIRVAPPANPTAQK